MTYREAIQSQVKKLQEVYENAGDLRDVAIDDEKDYFNDLRTLLYASEKALNKLDNRLSDDRAHLQLKGKY